MRRLTAALTAACLLLAGCGGADAQAAAPVDADDVMFLQMMIPHAKQGIEIVRLAAGKAEEQEIRTLAAAMEATQNAEIATMSGLLRGWDQPLTAPSDAHSGHGGLPETDREQIARLRGQKAADFDREFLHLMIAHLDDAVQMAKVEVYNGTNPEVKGLAEQIDKARSAQIDYMLTLVTKAPGTSS